jgi:hypothetical protein
MLAKRGHAVAGTGGRRMAHVLEHVPPTGGYPEGGEVSKINAVLSATPKDIHGVVDKSCGVAFSGNRYIPNALLFAPTVGARIIGPDIVEPRDAIRTTEEIELVIPRDDRVIRPGRWRAT